MLMTDSAALLAGILAEPEDDLPRLVYADWLEEHGEDARAEFIRVQIELHHTPCDMDVEGEGPYKLSCNNSECRNTQLISRQSELLGIAMTWTSRVHQRELMLLGETIGAMWAFHGDPWTDKFWDWRRGFVSEISCTETDWLTHGPAIVREHPIERVTLTDKRPWQGPTSGLWWWYEASSIPQGTLLRNGLSQSLIGHLRCYGDHPTHAWCYPNEESAVYALSQACIAWAAPED